MRLNLRNLQDLMTFRLRIFIIKLSAAVFASGRLDASDLVYLLNRQQSAVMAFMARLSSRLARLGIESVTRDQQKLGLSEAKNI